MLIVSDYIVPEYRFLVFLVELEFFYGPNTVVAYDNGDYVKQEEHSLPGDYMIMATWKNRMIVNN